MARRDRGERDDPNKTRTAVAAGEVLTARPARLSRHSEGDFDEGVTDVGAEESATPMTHYAARSALVADAVREDLANKRYGRGPARQVQISEPDGPSTDGGLKARQAILLVPAQGASPTLHCGWMDAAKMTAQLKSWDAVARKHRARFGTDPELLRGAYEAFLVDVRRTLLGHGLDVQLVVPEDDPVATLPSAAPPPVGGVRPAVVLVIAVAAFALGVVAAMLLR